MNRSSAMWLAAWLAVGGLAVSTGCGDDFDRASLVNSLRVLAIRAEPPQIPLEGTATLDPLVHTPGPSVTYEWSVCLVGVDTAAGFQCGDSAFECPLGDGETATLTPAALLTDCLADVEIPPDFAALAGLDESNPESLLEFFATPRPVTVQLRVNAGGARVDSIKRVLLGGEPPFNANPTFGEVRAANEPWSADAARTFEATEKVRVALDVAEGSRESFVDPGGNERIEEMLYAVFATDGEFDGDFASDERPEREWRAPELDEGEDEREVTFWFVVRDGRGGVDWTERAALIVRPPSEEAP